MTQATLRKKILSLEAELEQFSGSCCPLGPQEKQILRFAQNDNHRFGGDYSAYTNVKTGLELLKRVIVQEPDFSIDEVNWQKVRSEARTTRKKLHQRRYGKPGNQNRAQLSGRS